MMGKLLRRFGFAFVGCLTVIGGGLMIIYGLLLLYVSAPNPRSPSDLQFIHDVARWLLDQEVLYLLVAVGIAGFLWEVKREGFLPRDDRLRYQIDRDRRRELAEETEVWDAPDGERKTDPYEQLHENLHEETRQLSLVKTRFDESETPSVAGRLLNSSDRTPYRDVVVEISFFDDEKTHLDTTYATRQSLDPSSSWEFEVFPSPDTESAVQYYRVTDIRAKPV